MFIYNNIFYRLFRINMVFELLDGRVCRAKNSKKARGQLNKIFIDLIFKTQ